jgi:hypothetical protein
MYELGIVEFMTVSDALSELEELLEMTNGEMKEFLESAIDDLRTVLSLMS